MSLGYPSYEEVQKVRELLSHTSYQHWVSDEFLSWKWWLLVGLSTIPWLIWWMLVDKKKMPRVLLYGLILAIQAVVLDDIGTDQIWWGYPDKLFQMIPPLLPADLTLVPTLFMVVYNYFPSGRNYWIALVLMSLFCAFVGEPLFIWLDFYRIHEWSLIYSLVFYLVANTITRLIVDKLYGVAESHQ